MSRDKNFSEQIQGLRRADLNPNPIAQFKQWLDEAWAAKIGLAHAMTLATATLDGLPSARMIILRGLDERGFVFYTHLESYKSDVLAENPQASLVSFWRELERQVRIDGQVERVSRAEVEAFFQTRPRGNQLQLWLSNQRDVIANRQVLLDRLEQLEQKYAGNPIPAPPDWVGYRLLPDRFDFWQGLPGYTPDRFRYSRSDDHDWLIERVSP